MDDQTSLDALLPSPQLPQSMPPMAGVSGSDHIQRTHMAPSFKPSLPMMRLMWANLTLYVSFFLATVALSMSAPRDLLLDTFLTHIPLVVLSLGKGQVR
jgi:hypothetical protein